MAEKQESKLKLVARNVWKTAVYGAAPTGILFGLDKWDDNIVDIPIENIIVGMLAGGIIRLFGNYQHIEGYMRGWYDKSDGYSYNSTPPK